MRALRRFGAVLLVGAVALVGAVVVPSAAIAAPGDDVLIFSNSDVVDTGPIVDGGEYELISAAITAAGYTVTSFDGGDGSASAWAAALVDIEVFVLPEQEKGVVYDPLSPPAWMSTAAKDVLVDWVRDGGTLLISGTQRTDQGGSVHLINDAVGVDYTGALGYADYYASSARFISDASLPAQLTYANGTYAIPLTGFSESQLAPLSVWYAGTDECFGEMLAVGEFAAGSGRVAFEAWDYYNDEDANQTDWNTVLAALIDGNAAASTWMPAVDGPPPAPISTVTGANEALYTISPRGCDDLQELFRVDPTTAQAVAVGGSLLDGWATQGAWNRATNTAYFPFYDYEEEEYVLMTVNPTTGDFSGVGAFTLPDLDYFDDVFSLAIGPDGSAYLMAEVEFGDTYYELALFSLNLSNASLTFIAQIDDSVLDEPNGFAADPRTGLLYAFEEDSHELFRVNAQTGALTSLGFIDAPSIESSSDVTALQIGVDGRFWVVFDVEEDSTGNDVGMLATFTLSDIVGTDIMATEGGIITNAPMESWSLLLVPGSQLADTGADAGGLLAGSIVLLLLGASLVAVRMRRRAQIA